MTSLVHCKLSLKSVSLTNGAHDNYFHRKHGLTSMHIIYGDLDMDGR